MFPKWIIALLALLVIIGGINLYLHALGHDPSNLTIGVFCFILLPIVLAGEIIFEHEKIK